MAMLFSFTVFLKYVILGKERIQLVRMELEIRVWHPFKQIDQIFERVNAIGLAGFNHAVDGSVGRGPLQ